VSGGKIEAYRFISRWQIFAFVCLGLMYYDNSTMYRGYVPPKEVTDPTPPLEVDSKPKNQQKVLYGIIVVLTGLLFVSWVVIFLLAKFKDDQSFSQVSTVGPREETVAANGYNLDPLRDSVSGMQPESLGSEAVMNAVNAGAINLEALQKAAGTSEYASMYSNALGSAQDAKIRSDLTGIATAMMIRMYEEGLPENFPKAPRCIGTSPSCFDLYKTIVPMLLEKPYLHPDGGTLENSKYFIGTLDDGIHALVLHATGSDGNLIEVKK